MLKLLEKLFGENSESKIKEIQPLVDKINALEDEYKNLSDDELKAKTAYFKNRIQENTWF